MPIAACGYLVLFQTCGWASLRYGQAFSVVVGSALGAIAFLLWGDHALRRWVAGFMGVTGAAFGAFVLAITPVVEGPLWRPLSHLPVTHGYLAGVLRQLDLPPTLRDAGIDEGGNEFCFDVCSTRSHLYLAPGDLSSWKDRMERVMGASGYTIVEAWRVVQRNYQEPETHVLEIRKGGVQISLELNDVALFSQPGNKSRKRIAVPVGHVGIELRAGTPW